MKRLIIAIIIMMFPVVVQGNSYYSKTGNPAPNSQGSSADMRAEFALIEAGFDKIADPAGNGGEIVTINTGGTAQETQTAAELKATLSLENVDNTADADKPVSTATQAALNTLQSTLETAHDADISTLTSSIGLKAAIASPALTGTPTAPTADEGTDSTQIATTAFVQQAVAPETGATTPIVGGIYGGDYYKVSTTHNMVQEGWARDSTNSVWLYWTNQSVQALVSDGMQYLFACDDGTVRVDTSAYGTSLLSAYTKRWIGAYRVSSGVIVDYVQSGDYFQYTKASDAVVDAIATSYTTISTTGWTGTRVAAIKYGINGGAGYVYISYDGTNTTGEIGRGSTYTADTHDQTWGAKETPSAAFFTARRPGYDWYFKSTASGSSLMVSAFIMKR